MIMKREISGLHTKGKIKKKKKKKKKRKEILVEIQATEMENHMIDATTQ